MTHKLNDFKRSLAESTYNQNSKHLKSAFDATQMVEESKRTIRSSEPYIGGEQETGERIHKFRNKSKELANSSSQRTHTKSMHRERILTSNYDKRMPMHTSIEHTGGLVESTIKIIDDTRLDTAGDSSATKIPVKRSKVRPVSAYTHSNVRKVTHS